MLLSEFIRESSLRLSSLYGKGEAEAITLRLCEDRLGVKAYTHILEPLREIAQENMAGLQEDMERLLGGEPLQYVLGWTEFCSLVFKVGPGVLIPRPETEEMTGMACSILRSSPGKKRVLDLCTGSGCIAWTVFKSVPEVEVYGVDISEEALAVAGAQFEGDGPVFLKEDILKDESALQGGFDMIISNPPYIMEKEKTDMRRNVLDFEPPAALFVPDNDPLVFYRAIAGKMKRFLKRGGVGLLEINEVLGEESAELFRSQGIGTVRLLKDFVGKNRFLLIEKEAA